MIPYRFLSRMWVGAESARQDQQNTACRLAMPKVYYFLAIIAAVLQATFVARAQELEPRAYSISPQGTNFLILGFTRLTGDISFDPDLPIEDATSTLHTTTLGYVRAIGIAGRSASVGLVAPYVWGSV